MMDWIETLPGVLNRAWDLLADGAARRNRAANRPVLATVSPDGWPEARILVLRDADRGRGLLRFFTDSGTEKIASFAHAPRAAIHVWDVDTAIQLRLSVRIQVRTGAVTQADWDALPASGVRNYGKVPTPGSAIDAPLAYAETRDRAAFAVIEAGVAAIELLHLGDTHRRARFAADNGWVGHWVSP